MNCPEKRINAVPSEKIYVKGSLFPIEVGMRTLKLSRTYICNNQEFSSFPLYDTSGPCSDPSISVDPEKGLPRIRDGWDAVQTSPLRHG